MKYSKIFQSIFFFVFVICSPKNQIFNQNTEGVSTSLSFENEEFLFNNSKLIQVSHDGKYLGVVNPDNSSVSLFMLDTLEKINEVYIDDEPRTIAFSYDNSFMYVTNYSSNKVSVVDLKNFTLKQIEVGEMPYGVAVSKNYIYISLEKQNEVLVLENSTYKKVKVFKVDLFPTGIALNNQGLLAVSHLKNGSITIVNLKDDSLINYSPPNSEYGISQNISFDISNKNLWLPQTKSFEKNKNLEFDNTIFPALTYFDLEKLQYSFRNSLSLDSVIEPVNMPFDLVQSKNQELIFIANAGSNDISVIQSKNGLGEKNISVGDNPRGIAISRDGNFLFVNNVLEGTVSMIEVSTLEVVKIIENVVVNLDKNILNGKILFNTSLGNMSKDSWISCASCHFDGRNDGKTWVRFDDGTKNTTSLINLNKTLPLHWAGDLDEIADVEVTIRNNQGGAGLITGEVHDTLGSPNALRSEQLEDLVDYLETFQINRSVEEINNLPGYELFNDLNCNSCHSGVYFTDNLNHTIDGFSINTPSLFNLWDSNPYFHDGSIESLNQIFVNGHGLQNEILNEAQIKELVEFLKSLP